MFGFAGTISLVSLFLYSSLLVTVFAFRKHVTSHIVIFSFVSWVVIKSAIANRVYVSYVVGLFPP